MIRQTKRDVPPLELTTAGYTNKAVKQALIEDVHGKCYLCERKPTAPEVEHLQPKMAGAFPEFINTWTNLFLACPHSCNQRRLHWKTDGDKQRWPEHGLLNPGVHDVEARLVQTAVHTHDTPLMTVEFAAVDSTDLPAVNTARELNHIHDDTTNGRALRSALTDRVNLFHRLYLRWDLAKRKGHAGGPHHALVPLRALFRDSATFAGLMRSWARRRFVSHPTILEELGLQPT